MARLVAPRRKKRVFCTKESPFPVPIESITHESVGADQWFFYTAYLTGNTVTVRHSGDINFLFKMGFFGKGNLSRSQPEFNHRYRTVRVPHPADVDSIVQPRVISHRVFKQRMRWAGTNVADEPLDSSSEEETAMMDTRDDQVTAQTKPAQREGDINLHVSDSGNKDVSFDSSSVSLKTGTEYRDLEEEEADVCTDKDKKADETGASWDTTEGAEFWGVGESGVVKQKVGDAWATEEADAEFWGEAGSGDVKQKVGKDEEEHAKMRENQDEDSPRTGEPHSCSESAKSEATVTNAQESSNVDCHNKTCDMMSVAEHGTSGSANVNDKQISNAETFQSETNIGEAATSPPGETGQKKCSDDVPIQQVDVENGQCNDLDPVEYDPLCHSDDLDGDVFVMADSDEDNCKKQRKLRKRRWRPVLKKDPYPVVEHLQLSFEETFFLSYGLGCLVVTDEKQSNLSLSSLWQRFCSCRADFCPSYIAYHYYRSKGWVPKTGLKFGCDFIVYKEGPPFYHGSYSVLVRLVDEETLTEHLGSTHRPLSWISLAGLNRITEHVAKELLICYVIKPRGVTEESLMSPACIPQFKVQEVLVSRWVSSQERQEKEVEEFP
ncbi:tRNA-splicing endonuclease subunit Sen2-like [Haliotis rufescens]|uniref:tRNA-splicing endonuclease subunit Sen2-like n=1 Tax=Haliotis rufescens TaxID=6454 RepID=UPI00201EEDF0|nr:tRNA-splicing endonuclease subunit Sen2-like [Haliotis rufescens]XP_046363041.2 tRNA-splicing endonuclease subunit Sen2-like [Haliotis rufescens]